MRAVLLGVIERQYPALGALGLGRTLQGKNKVHPQRMSGTHRREPGGEPCVSAGPS